MTTKNLNILINTLILFGITVLTVYALTWYDMLNR